MARSLRAQKVRSERWRRHYNEQRPHQGLGMQVPAACYHKSRRRMPQVLRAWQYALGWESRRVKANGTIPLHGRSRFVGEAFAGERVGLKRSRVGVWEVYFGPHLLGELWDCETSGIRALWYRRGRWQK